MTYSGAYNDYLTAYGGTTHITFVRSSMFLWDPPTLPTMYVKKTTAPVIAPFVEMRFNRFFGIKFKIGGSKK